MLVARKSTAQNATVTNQKRSSGRNLAVSPTSNRQLSQKSAPVSHRHPTNTTPIWLLRLISVNRYTSIVTFLLVGTTLIIYGWTVYSQSVWQQAYRRVQSLQSQERQLITTNATLTSKMAEEAEQPKTGLLLPNPAGIIFLSPAENNHHHAKNFSATNRPHRQQQISFPLGY
jgi:hypothetical protein